MKALSKIEKMLDFICKTCLVLLFAVIIVSGFMQVFWRTVLNNPLSWSDELCRYGMIWMTFIGAGYAVKRNAHVAVDIIKGILPQRAVNKIEKVNLVFILIVSGIFISFGSKLAIENITQMSPGLGLSMGSIYAAVPIGGTLMAFYAVLQIFNLQEKLVEYR